MGQAVYRRDGSGHAIKLEALEEQVLARGWKMRLAEELLKFM